MKYATIKRMDISNGLGIGVSIFVQGCHFHCKNCFNPETWDFYGGKEFDNKAENELLRFCSLPYIKRFSVLGGEPLDQFEDVLKLIKKVKETKHSISVWLYSGYTFEEIKSSEKCEVLKYIDVLVDGRFIDSKKDLTLLFKGSVNQRIIDVPKTLKSGDIALLKLDK